MKSKRMENPNKDIILEHLDTKRLADDILKHASESGNEEDIKIRVETTLRPILEKWGIQWASYEHRHEISGARKDALYGHVVIEYKAPGELNSKSKFAKFKEKVKEYISKEAVDPKYFGRWFGIILDGYKISFVRFRKNEWEEQDEPLEVNKETIKTLLRAIRGLRLRVIDPESLVKDFGPGELSRNVIHQLYLDLVRSKSKRTDMLFEDWKRVFSQVCAYSPDKLVALVEYYGLKDQILDREKLMFAIHTYYTLLMKFLTSEVISYFNPMFGSFLERIDVAYHRSADEMKNELENLEEGGIIAQLGIMNLLEADYFAWYLDEWNEETAEVVISIVEKLKEYDPGTSELYPEKVKDLFKRLYQNLVPKKVRHDLGEYFTADWLAELLLDEVGYDGNPNKRILDPACGSGTFLVLAIKRILDCGEREFYPDKSDLLRKIINNVVGIDLNPLAVLASRANYILALGELNRLLPGQNIDIPVYLADSILVSRKQTFYGEWEVYLNTTVGEFRVPHEIIDRKLLPKALVLIEIGIKGNYGQEEFRGLLNVELKDLKDTSIESLVGLYMFVSKLEKEEKNRIWTRLLKNSFAPLLMGKFDYVIGNPPWINWENLPERYREDTKRLWDWYGLLKKTKGIGLGKVKRDMAMLFLARCLDRYTKENGKFSFLIPFTTYKTQAGAGFREFLSKGYWKNEKINSPCSVQKIHDLVTLYPFEGAVNRTSLIVIKKSGKTEFPISCKMWYNPRYKGIEMEADLEEVKKTTQQFNMIFTPVKKGKPETPWMLISEKAKKAIDTIVGESPYYKAYEGINTALNAVYWIDIISKQPHGLLITNTKAGGLKKKVREIKTVIEPELMFPLIRGRDVKRWFIESYSNYIILPTNENGETIEHSELKVKHPKVYEYFLNFMKDLTNRGGEPYKSKLEPYRKKPINRAEKEAPPFYWLFNASPSLAKYKVVWKRIAGGITGKAVSFASAVIEPLKDKFLTELKPVVLNDSLILIPFNEENEAYYVSGALNSTPVLFTIASYTYELRMETHITQYIKIPKFNPKDKFHIKLSELSKKAHELAKKYYEQNDLVAQDELKKIEEKIDKTVAELYGITGEELEEIKKTLRILKEGEVEEEEEETEGGEIVLSKSKDIEIKVEPLFVQENEEKELKVVVGTDSNSDKIIEEVKAEVYLEKKLLASQEIKRIDSNSPVDFSFKVPKLESGEHELRITLTINGNKIEEKRKLFVRSEKKKIKKVKSSVLDEEIERIIG